jgi:hypothetical protein
MTGPTCRRPWCASTEAAREPLSSGRRAAAAPSAGAPARRQETSDRLIERFPHEREGLQGLFDVVAHFGEAARRWPLAGQRPHLPPSQLSAMVWLSLIDHYLDGAFFPRGGAGALRDALVDAAVTQGARFRTGAEVAEILLRGSSVIGVRLARRFSPGGSPSGPASSCPRAPRATTRARWRPPAARRSRSSPSCRGSRSRAGRPRRRPSAAPTTGGCATRRPARQREPRRLIGRLDRTGHPGRWSCFRASSLVRWTVPSACSGGE